MVVVWVNEGGFTCSVGGEACALTCFNDLYMS